jgi:hypothetical protein
MTAVLRCRDITVVLVDELDELDFADAVVRLGGDVRTVERISLPDGGLLVDDVRLTSDPLLDSVDWYAFAAVGWAEATKKLEGVSVMKRPAVMALLRLGDVEVSEHPGPSRRFAWKVLALEGTRVYRGGPWGAR